MKCICGKWCVVLIRFLPPSIASMAHRYYWSQYEQEYHFFSLLMGSPIPKNQKIIKTKHSKSFVKYIIRLMHLEYKWIVKKKRQAEEKK